MATSYDRLSDRELIEAASRGELKAGLAEVMMSQRLGEKMAALAAALDTHEMATKELVDKVRVLNVRVVWITVSIGVLTVAQLLLGLVVAVWKL